MNRIWKRTNWICLGIAFTLVVSMADVSGADYELTWSAEFNSAVIDNGTWQAETNPGVVYNANQQQFYTDRKENVFVNDGKLVIQTIKEPYRELNLSAPNYLRPKVPGGGHQSR